MNDEDLASAITAYMAAHPHATRAELRTMLNTSDQRMKRLHDEGLIKMPAPLSRSVAGTISRKKNQPYKGWYISKPSPWQKGAA